MTRKKAVLIFLLITFSATIALIIGARLSGFSLFGAPVLMSQMFILGAMFIPGLTAIALQKFVLKRPLKEMGFKVGDWKMYLKTYAVIVLMFVLNYLITWIFFLKPDFTLLSFLNQFNITAALPMPAPMMVFVFGLVTFFAAPIFNMIPSMGEEIGWRGFLLPNLEPLGKTKAMIFSGAIWALWHTPMILILGFAYGEQFLLGAILHFLMVTSLGIWMGHIWFKTRDTVLAGFIHSVFNANSYGIWVMIFVSNNKLLIGGAGAIGTFLCIILGTYAIYIESK